MTKHSAIPLSILFPKIWSHTWGCSHDSAVSWDVDSSWTAVSELCILCLALSWLLCIKTSCSAPAFQRGYCSNLVPAKVLLKIVLLLVYLTTPLQFWSFYSMGFFSFCSSSTDCLSLPLVLLTFSHKTNFNDLRVFQCARGIWTDTWTYLFGACKVFTNCKVGVKHVHWCW